MSFGHPGIHRDILDLGLEPFEAMWDVLRKPWNTQGHPGIHKGMLDLGLEPYDAM